MPAQARRSPRKGGTAPPRPRSAGPILGVDEDLVLSNLLRKWPMILGLSFAGALVGLAFGTLHVPRYEAEAVLNLSLDYGRSAPLELIVEDRLLDRVWGFLTSDEVLEGAAARLTQAHGVDRAWASAADLRRSARLEARLARWTFIGVHTSPDRAADIANAWADSAFGALREASDHAWRAVELQDGVFSPSCVRVAIDEPRESLWECFSMGPHVDPSQVGTLRAEIDAAHGVTPMLSFERGVEAVPPLKPTTWDQGWLVLAGALVGLLAASGGIVFARRILPA